jgi:hypothetical protein
LSGLFLTVSAKNRKPEKCLPEKISDTYIWGNSVFFEYTKMFFFDRNRKKYIFDIGKQRNFGK